MENIMEFVPVNITVIEVPQRLTVSYSTTLQYNILIQTDLLKFYN